MTELHQKDDETANNELKKKTANVHHTRVLNEYHNSLSLLFQKFSSFTRLQRTIAYVIRFIKNCKGLQKQTDNLSTAELKNAESVIIKNVQHHSWNFLRK